MCLGTAEIFARLLFSGILLYPRFHTDASYGEYTLRRLRPDSVFWHSSSKGAWKFVTNSQGFRDDENYAYEKPKDVVRVLSLGDSHTQGFEVRQHRTFSEVLERYLNARGIRAQVLNSGVSGFSTAEQLAFLENEGIRYKPDFVVVGFYSNDFEDNIKAGLFTLQDGDLIAAKKVHIPGVRILNVINAVPTLRWLSQNSYLYSLAMNSAWRLGKNLLWSKSKARLQTEFALSTEELTDFKKELTVQLLTRMKAYFNENGGRLIILDLPQPTDELGRIKPSVPTDLAPAFVANSHNFITSDDALNQYRDTAEFHVPNGQRHISEFTHLIFGIEVGRAIMSAYSQNKKPRAFRSLYVHPE
jgi:hypothetical protein